MPNLVIKIGEKNVVFYKIRIFIFAVLSVLFLAVVISYINFSIIKIDNGYRDGFERALIYTVKNEKYFMMKNITNFDWDKMFVFCPYTNRDKIEQEVGMKWVTTQSYFGYLVDRSFLGQDPLCDDIFEKLVFVKDNKVICDCTIERYNGDFTKVPSQINRTEANFIVEKNNDNWALIKLQNTQKVLHSQ